MTGGGRAFTSPLGRPGALPLDPAGAWRPRPPALVLQEGLVGFDHVLDRGVVELLAVLGPGQRRIGADAAVREAAAVVGGLEKAAALGRDLGRHLRLLYRTGLVELRQRDLGGGRMAAIAVAIELVGELAGPWPGGPERHAALQRRPVRSERGFGIDLVECRRHRRDVPAMAVDEEEPFEPVPRQRQHHVPNHQHQRRRPQRGRAGESQMMLRHPVSQRRRHHRADGVAHALGHELRVQMVGADQAVRPMLLHRADRHDAAALGAEVVLHLVPGGEGELHAGAPAVWRLLLRNAPSDQAAAQPGAAGTNAAAAGTVPIGAR